MSTSVDSRGLTRKQRAAMRLFITEGRCDEGSMANLWPVIQSPRHVVNALREKGLVVLESWGGEEWGYELRLTDVGREVVAAMQREEGS